MNNVKGCHNEDECYIIISENFTHSELRKWDHVFHFKRLEKHMTRNSNTLFFENKPGEFRRPMKENSSCYSDITDAFRPKDLLVNSYL